MEKEKRNVEEILSRLDSYETMVSTRSPSSHMFLSRKKGE